MTQHQGGLGALASLSFPFEKRCQLLSYRLYHGRQKSGHSIREFYEGHRQATRAIIGCASIGMNADANASKKAASLPRSPAFGIYMCATSGRSVRSIEIAT